MATSAGSVEKESVCRYLAAEDLRSVFKFLSDQDIETLCNYLEFKEWPPETILMREGEVGDFMGFLVKGKLAVKKETRFQGKYILLAILEPGTMVGEIAAMELGKRNATVSTMEESQMLILSSEKMNLLTEEQPGLGVKLLRRLIQILSRRLQKADDRLSKLL